MANSKNKISIDALRITHHVFRIPYSVIRTLLPVLLIFVLISCSSEKQNNDGTASPADAPVEQLDPYSAPLYPSKAKAEAQDFTVDLLNGDTFQLSDYRGQVVLMNIWATWCAPCHDETPDFVDLYKQYRDQGLVILGVSIDEQGLSVVKPFMEKYDVNYPMVIDDGTIMDKYGPTMGIPTSYIIDKEGNLRYFALGALTEKELEPRLLTLLNE